MPSTPSTAPVSLPHRVHDLDRIRRQLRTGIELLLAGAPA
jgi:hypothetical protein